ncbi:hypothetical protein [Sphingomonas albertensis]|uniref:Uncharacterized protein n=1 Tax=Sphingomonas albertensis TaxID=2762591 RepID=A0ABR7ANF3_9SPHN|nr:hypothetical protein [Sphingomonas albertensis]MBC3941982.1 hypothetical protein [Sphingomonas albertensis]
MVGVILNLALWFAIHTLFRTVAPIATGPFRFDAPVFASLDPWALTLSAAAIVAVLRFKTGTLRHWRQRRWSGWDSISAASSRDAFSSQKRLVGLLPHHLNERLFTMVAAR